MLAYEQAADWYSAEDSSAYTFFKIWSNYRQANNCLLKVAAYAAQLENYEKAIDNFEKVASKAADNQLMRFSLREYFLKAGLCVICTKVSFIILRKGLRSS